jgi:hypothetical protein
VLEEIVLTLIKEIIILALLMIIKEYKVKLRKMKKTLSLKRINQQKMN